jgi:hypothetical protein
MLNVLGEVCLVDYCVLYHKALVLLLIGMGENEISAYTKLKI